METGVTNSYALFVEHHLPVIAIETVTFNTWTLFVGRRFPVVTMETMDLGSLNVFCRTSSSCHCHGDWGD